MRTDRAGVSSMVVLLVVVLVVAATVIFAVTSQQEESGPRASSSTQQSTGPTTASATNSSVALSYGSTSQSSQVNQTLPADCSDISHPSANGDVLVGTSAPAIICLQLYYYNQDAPPVTLDMTAFLDIYAVQYGNGTVRSFDGGSNFTITASQDQLVLGGPTNENEGAVVAVAITANPGASGTYELDLHSQVQGGLSAFRLGGGDVEICGDYGEITAGNGMPDYSPGVGCTVSIPKSSPWNVLGLPYDLDNGDTYFRIIAEGNSAG
ncbi:MAG: hypothetical protein OK442_04030 [Thaumarchaeota archaeon]|nr:hypothetical protein [Nitrososphaerota archaeon]